MRIILFTFMVLIADATSVTAQSGVATHRFTFLKTDYDTSYVQVLPERWRVNLFLTQKGYSFADYAKLSGTTFSFNPTSKLILGTSVSYKNFSLYYGLAIASSASDSVPASHRFGFITSVYVGQHVFDVAFHSIKGFRTSADDAAGMQAYRSDIGNTTLLLNYLYNFNYKKFSFNAAFSGSQVQKRTAGTPLAGLFINYFDVHANDGILIHPIEDFLLYPHNFSEANILSLGLLGGYAATVVLPYHLYFTFSLAPGLSFNLGEMKSNVYLPISNSVSVSYKVLSREVFGYSGNSRLFGYVAFFADHSVMAVNIPGAQQQIKSTWSNFLFSLGYRFD